MVHIYESEEDQRRRQKFHRQLDKMVKESMTPGDTRTHNLHPIVQFAMDNRLDGKRSIIIYEMFSKSISLQNRREINNLIFDREFRYLEKREQRRQLRSKTHR